MAKYITRTIVNYNTKVSFVMNNQLDTYELFGEVGKKEAKKQLISIMGTDDIVVINCEKVEVSSKLYRMLESDFISNAELLGTEIVGSSSGE